MDVNLDVNVDLDVDADADADGGFDGDTVSVHDHVDDRKPWWNFGPPA